MTAKVAKSCPDIWRQELHEQSADFKGSASLGRDSSCLKDVQWHDTLTEMVEESIMALQKMLIVEEEMRTLQRSYFHDMEMGDA